MSTSVVPDMFIGLEARTGGPSVAAAVENGPPECGLGDLASVSLPVPPPPETAPQG